MHEHPPIVIAPVPASESIEVEPRAVVTLSFAGVREALAQPAYSHEPEFPADPAVSRCVWRVRDTVTGALLVVWDRDSSAPTPAQTSQWLAWWADGPEHPGSGRRMVEVLLGEDACGQIHDR